MIKIYKSKKKYKELNHVLYNLPSSPFKSIRQLVIAVLTPGVCCIKNFSTSDDAEILIKVLKQLGWKIIVKKDELKIVGGIDKIKICNNKLDLQSSGLGFRLIMMLCSLGNGTYDIIGDERMKNRTVKDLEVVMKELNINLQTKNGFPPVKVNGIGLDNKFVGGEVFLSGKETSQFHTALLLIGAQNKKGLIVKSDNVVSKFYINMTMQQIKNSGVDIFVSDDYKRFEILKQQRFKKIKSVIIDCDLVMVSYFLYMTALIGGKMLIPLSKKLKEAIRNDRWILCVLRKHFNCDIIIREKILSIDAKGKYKPFIINANDIPFLLPSLAIMSLTTKGKCIIKNISSSNNKMTARKDDTIPLVLKKLGAKVKQINNDIEIIPPKKIKNVIITQKEHKNDHRIVMALGFLSKLDGVEIGIENPEASHKTFKNYFSILDSIKPIKK